MSPDQADLLWAELAQLALSEGAAELEETALWATDHAVLRARWDDRSGHRGYRQRVEALPKVRARRRLERLVLTAEWHEFPRA
jgi:hypothetical protein